MKEVGCEIATDQHGGFHSYGGTPKNGWFISWKIPRNWMIWGYPYFRKPPNDLVGAWGDRMLQYPLGWIMKPHSRGFAPVIFPPKFSQEFGPFLQTKTSLDTRQMLQESLEAPRCTWPPFDPAGEVGVRRDGCLWGVRVREVRCNFFFLIWAYPMSYYMSYYIHIPGKRCYFQFYNVILYKYIYI